MRSKRNASTTCRRWRPICTAAKRISRERIRTAIDKLYLEGYFFDGTKLTLNENKKLKAKPIYTKCPNCGASLPTPQEGDESVTCKYCGSVFPIK